jgi:hypothetical protein
MSLLIDMDLPVGRITKDTGSQVFSTLPVIS